MFMKLVSLRVIQTLLLKEKNEDVDIIYSDKTIHCWLEPNILTYDRPTLSWCNDEIKNASLMLLGNGDVNIEGNILKEKYWGNLKLVVPSQFQPSVNHVHLKNLLI